MIIEDHRFEISVGCGNSISFVAAHSWIAINVKIGRLICDTIKTILAHM